MYTGVRAIAICAMVAAASFVTFADVTPQSQAGEIERRLGDQFFADGRYADALDAYRRALQASAPADPRATRAGMVQAALRIAEFATARTEALALLTASPADPMAMTLYADALWASGLFEEAETRYQDALNLQPELPRGLHGMARSLAARSKLSDALDSAH